MHWNADHKLHCLRRTSARVRADLSCIKATTIKEYSSQAKGKREAFERQLVILRVQEPSHVVACHMLHVLALGYEQYRSVAPRASMARSLKLRPCKCRTGVDRSPAR